MYAVHINPAVLKQCRKFTLQESVAHLSYSVEKAFEAVALGAQPPINSTLSLKAGEAFSLGLEILEYLAEREKDDFVNQIVMYPQHPNAKENDSWI